MPLLRKLLNMLSLTRERELTCDEVFKLADYYVELQHQGENVQSLMPSVAQHLKICVECADEFEAMMRIIGAQPDNQ
ncbi:MAG: hypothetical protein J5I90_03515 [Caldilineales bacterium]|nr:hypothetical protein [Caldilineales bacterium]